MIADAGFATGGNFEGDGSAWRNLWGGDRVHTYWSETLKARVDAFGVTGVTQTLRRTV